MKPRLTICHGIWRCNRPGERDPCGFGYTAQEAFDDWLAECWRVAPCTIYQSEVAALHLPQTMRAKP